MELIEEFKIFLLILLVWWIMQSFKLYYTKYQYFIPNNNTSIYFRFFIIQI